jgi:pimeloyl-ACP methyl ester carboxylesterase
MAYDSARGQIVLFGGWSDGEDVDLGYKNDTWLWDGHDWTQVFPAHVPPPLAAHAMTYDSARSQVVLFGGVVRGSEYLDETWVWDGRDWTPKNPEHSPAPREHPALAYNSARGYVVLFGGWVPFHDDTWVWDGNDWTQKSPVMSPAPRYRSAMAYDSARSEIVLFGGESGIYDYLNDTWVWGINNQPQPTTGTISVTTNLQAATFFIFGPANYFGSGTSLTINGAPAGTYTITYGDVDGYITPTNEVKDLTAGGTISFTASYLAPPRVVLVHGWCSDPTTFGSMRSLLSSKGSSVASPFDYSAFTKPSQSPVSIEELATQFATHVNQVLDTYNATQVDVVAHSMGALITRAWMAGMATVKIPYEGQIRRLVTIGTPHYGSSPKTLGVLADLAAPFGGGCSTTQRDQLALGSHFITRLHDQWKIFQEGPFRINSKDILYVAGTRDAEDAKYECKSYDVFGNVGCSDGIVDISSAVLPTSPGQQIRYVDSKHSDAVPRPDRPGMADVDTEEHTTFRLVSSFLNDGLVLSQCCTSDSVGYNPPHLRSPGDDTGMIVLRLIDGETNTPLADEFRVTFRGSTTDKVKFADNWNSTSGTYTIWGVPAGVYDITVMTKGVKRHAKAGKLYGIRIDVAHPTVPGPLKLWKQ